MAKSSNSTRRAIDSDAPGVQIKLGVLSDIITFRIRRIHNSLTRDFAKRLAREGVKPGYFSALALMAANPGVSQVSLAHAMGIDKAIMVALLDGLEKLGWAERLSTRQDRRRHSLHVTRKGEAALVKLRKIVAQNEAAAHAVLSLREQKELYRLLDKIFVVCVSGRA
jgi:DNA-binding MarR family transcriptional regulator